MYARRGGSRGGIRGAGNTKKSFSKKRAEPDSDDSAPRTSKKAKSDDEEELLVPQLEIDKEKNPFISVSTLPIPRRVT